MTQTIQGTLERSEGRGGWLRATKANYAPRRLDVGLSDGLCRELRLRGGEQIEAIAPPNTDKPKGMLSRSEQIQSINGLAVGDYLESKPFEELTAVDPAQPIRFETPGGPLSMRIIDLLTPIGLGQRGLIVAPPRTGKTILLQQMAAGIAANHPDVYMMVLLIDERPEEVTEMRRTVRGEVVASSNDEDVASHMRIARLMIEKAKRLVESGRDVLILLDSLTRLGRAFNAGMQGSRRIMSGGLDIRALAEPKGMFGAARNVENGGSLTIMASCLIETGSRMDEVIFNEFKGTGNMEIVLDRELANRRIWPAIDLPQSGTRKEELLLKPDALEASHQIRRFSLDRGPLNAMTSLLEVMGKHTDNASLVRHVLSQRR